MASWIDGLTNPTSTTPLPTYTRRLTMSVVCAQRIAGPVFASDHFGLLAQLPELRE